MPNRFIVLIALTLLLASTHTPATVAAPESVDEFTARISDELRNRNSAAAELFAEANQARDAEDWQTAEQLYRQVRELEPDFLHATRRLCGVVRPTRFAHRGRPPLSRQEHHVYGYPT